MGKTVKHRFLNSVLFTALFVPLGFFLLRDIIAAITGIMFESIGGKESLLYQINNDIARLIIAGLWLPISLLTLPGGAIAFFAKKQNVAGAVILGIGNTIVALMGVSYFLKLCRAFPRHLLTVVSCASIIVVLLLGMQKRWKTRILSAATTVLLTACVVI